MKRKGYQCCLVFSAFGLILAAFSNLFVVSVEQKQPDPWDYPRLDTVYFKVIKTEAARVDALTVKEEVDLIPGPSTTTNIEKVKAWGANMSWAPLPSYAFLALQCRDVWPEEAAGGTEGKTPGETTSPMNYSGFRVALSCIFGMDDKNATLWNRYGGLQAFGIQSIIPPAQAAWYDPTAKLPITNFTAAWELMQADGFYVSDGILYDNNGVPCRNLTLCYSNCGWWVMLPDFVTAFNDFMDNYLGVTNCNLVLKSKDFATLVYGNLLEYHDYDMISIGLTGLGPDCDWVVSMFHSDYDVVGGWNFAGVHDPYIDHLMDIIMHSMDPAEIKQAVYDFQHYFNGEMPESAIEFGATGKGWMPHFLWSSGMIIESYHPDLEGFVSSPCYGSLQPWTYCNLHWRDQPTGGTVRLALADDPTNLNPFYENTPYGWMFLNRLCEPLLQYNPINLEIMPWLTKAYYYQGPINATTLSGKKIVDGMKIDYYIREGVYWQDSGAYEDTNGNGHWDAGEPKYEFPFTAYDCKFAMDMFMKYRVGRYDTVWTDCVEASTEGPYKLTIWYNASSYWYSTYPSVLSYFPQHIYQKADKMVEEGTLAKFSDFKPAFTNYKTWMGLHPPDELGSPPSGPGKPGYWSALVGTGPFIFGYYNHSTWLGEIWKNTRYWAGASPVLQSLETWPGINCYKKEEVGPEITLENATVFNPTDPACSYLHETAPTACRKWHICGWKDLNKDGVVSACDEVTLCRDVCGNGQWVGQGEFHVESLVWDDVNKKWIIVVKEIQYTPKLTTTCIIIDAGNLVWERPTSVPFGIDVYYELFCNTEKIASEMVTNLGSFNRVLIKVPIPGHITPCEHTFKVDFYVRVAGSAETPHYVCSVTKLLAYLPGDTNCDCRVDIKDIVAMILKFGYKEGVKGYDRGADVNADLKIDMKDIVIGILKFGTKCLS